MEIYIIMIQKKETGEILNVSTLGFDTIEKAQNWCKKERNCKEITGYKFGDKNLYYLIKPISIK